VEGKKSYMLALKSCWMTSACSNRNLRSESVKTVRDSIGRSSAGTPA
jgi:hypothetical protein